MRFFILTLRKLLFNKEGTDPKAHRRNFLKTIRLGLQLSVLSQLHFLQKAQAFSARAMRKARSVPSAFPIALWGLNNMGQLGNENITSQSSPVVLGGSWIKICCGYEHALGIQSDGTLWSWGTGSSGALGNGATLAKSSPVQVGTTLWSDISAGRDISLAIRSDGSLWSWGSNGGTSARGHLGIPIGSADSLFSLPSCSTPVQVAGGTWIQVTASAAGASFGIKSDGSLWCWGNNLHGHLGLGCTQISPNAMTGSWVQLSPGYTHTLGLKSDGSLWAWGMNGYGQLGQGNTTNVYSPVQVAGTWAQIFTGGHHSLAIKTDGTLWTWGKGAAGQLGNNAITSQSSPVQIPGTTWQKVCAGYDYSFAIKSDGSLWAWGEGSSGVLGDGTVGDKSSPVQIAGSWLQVSASFSLNNNHSMGLKADNTLWCWGYNGNGELGDQTATNQSSPIQIAGSWTNIAANYGRSHGIRSDGTLWSWGNNTYGQLGDSSTVSTSSPIQISGSWSQVMAGFRSTFGRKSDNTLWSWGNGERGEIGNGNTTMYYQVSSPVQVLGSWSQVTSHFRTVAGIKDDGTSWFWGDNLCGLWGNGIANMVPNQIPGTWTQISADRTDPGFQGHFLAIKSDGTLWGWGLNDSGQLGINSTSFGLSPIQISGSWSEIAVGNRHSLAINTSGALYSWGDGGSGRLGIGSSVSKSTPVLVAGAWQKISAGYTHSIGLRPDNSLWAWGAGTSGALGLNSTTNYSSPVQVSGNWSLISAGRNFSAGRKS